MKYEIRPYVPEDYAKIRNGGEDPQSLAGMGEEALSRTYALQGPAYSLWVDGNLVACGGIVVLWPGMGEAWCLVSERVKFHPLIFHKSAMKMIDEMAKERKLVRVQANVQKDFKTGNSWIQAIGFKPEGDMPMFFNGLTFTRYARIFQ